MRKREESAKSCSKNFPSPAMGEELKGSGAPQLSWRKLMGLNIRSLASLATITTVDYFGSSHHTDMCLKRKMPVFWTLALANNNAIQCKFDYSCCLYYLGIHESHKKSK